MTPFVDLRVSLLHPGRRGNTRDEQGVTVGNRSTTSRDRSFKVCRTVLHPPFVANNPLEALVAVTDVRLQSVVFAGEFPTKACLNMQIMLRFGQATVLSMGANRSRRRRMLTFPVSAHSTSRDNCRQGARGRGDRARTSHGCRENAGHTWRPTSRQATEARRKPCVARDVRVQERGGRGYAPVRSCKDRAAALFPS